MNKTTREKVSVKAGLPYNLSAYIILPLLKLNINSYGKDNFINSYVTKKGEVVVHIKNTEKAGDYYNHQYMIADVDEEDYTMIVYSLPEEWKEDFSLFLNSKYSQMSTFAKDQVTAHAKANELDWKKPTGRNKVIDGKRTNEPETTSSKLYHGLVKSELLKNMIEEELQIKLSKDTELIDVLDESEIIEL